MLKKISNVYTNSFNYKHKLQFKILGVKHIIYLFCNKITNDFLFLKYNIKTVCLNKIIRLQALLITIMH